jgi:thiol-disulfide isomerase/thioredoxin
MFQTARAFALFAVPALALGANFKGVWDGIIVAGGDQVDFKMEIVASPAKVCFFEDAQPVCSTSVKVEGEKLIAQWDFYKAELRLDAAAGKLNGVYHSFRSNRDFEVHAQPHHNEATWSVAPAKFGGDWEARVVGRENAATWQLLLRQTGRELKGTILRVDGDTGTMVGRAEGNHFKISHFAGDRPNALSGELKPDGSLELTTGETKLIAYRPAEARAKKLPPPEDPATHARVKNPDEPFRFRFPDLNGRMYSEADFRGRPLLVTISGSWCPNCRDEAPFLAELYERYHAKGLEIAAFCFEDASDAAHVQLRAFIRKFGLPYPALLAGEPFPEQLKEKVPQIENLTAYPSSIYIGKDGRVRAVHTGFPGPGSGEELTRVKAEIRQLVEKMLVE